MKILINVFLLSALSLICFISMPATAGDVKQDTPLHRVISLWCSPQRVEISKKLKFSHVCKPESVTEQVKSLIKNGADVNQSGEMGETPLRAAIRLNNTEVIEVLLDAGANVNEISDSESRGIQLGDTPLMGAINWYTLFKDIKPVKMLISHHPDLNYRNKKQYYEDCDQTTKGKCTWAGQTALTRASEDGEIQIVKLLLESGADPKFPRADGKTALEIARLHHQNEIAHLIIPYLKNAPK